MTTNEETQAVVNHPNPIDKNRSIVWARYHVDSDDWVLLAVKVTRHANSEGKEIPSLVTLALVDHAGSTLFETMIKASDMVSNDEIAQHGVEQSVIFKAKSFQEVTETLIKLIDDKTLVSWDPALIQKTFDELAELHGAEKIRWKSHGVAGELSRFVGKTDNPHNGYESQPLPLTGIGALDECKSVIKVIAEIAKASQASDAVAGGDPGWTAEFYKPKISATAKEKFKGFFGGK
jgi:hypothetical protein